MAKTLHFTSFANYKKYLAYGHIHGKFTERVQPKIVIAGSPHYVNHCEICKSTSHHTHAHNLYHPKGMAHGKHRKGSRHGKQTRTRSPGKSKSYGISINVPRFI